jgi:hypothetical protein
MRRQKCKDCYHYRDNYNLSRHYRQRSGNCFKKVRTRFMVYAKQARCKDFKRFMPIRIIKKNIIQRIWDWIKKIFKKGGSK